MKNLKLVMVALISGLFFVGCGTSVKVADQWKNDNFASLKGEKVLVIHKTPNEVSKKRFELDVANALRGIGIDAVEAYKAFPNHVAKENPSPEEVKQIVSQIKSAGYNGVIITVLKDKDQQVETNTSGGYYTGGYYPSHYGGYYGRFGAYYGGVHAYGYGGSYIPASSTTKVVDIYMLETVSYNLSLKESEQMVGVVSVKVTDPDSYSGVADKYVKIIVDQFSE